MGPSPVAVTILLGMHSAGKTTLGHQLAASGYSYFDEIGTQIRAISHCTVTTSCELFEREVMRLEIERDKTVLQATNTPVIETWHIGNIAFAEARGNLSAAARYRSSLRGIQDSFYVNAVHLQLDDDTFRHRVTERGTAVDDALAFYRDVEARWPDILEDLFDDCFELTFLDESARNSDAAAQVIRKGLRRRDETAQEN